MAKLLRFRRASLATSETVPPATSPGASAVALSAPQGALDIAESTAAVALPPGAPLPEGNAAHFAVASQSYANDSAVSVESANTVDDRYCAVPSCGQPCSDYTTSHAADIHNQNYLWYGGQSTCYDSTSLSSTPSMRSVVFKSVRLTATAQAHTTVSQAGM